MVKPTAKRCLFGADHAMTRTILDTQKREMYRDSENKWNFDFIHERPLEGRYLWKRVTPRNMIELPEAVCTKSSDSEPDDDERASGHLDVPAQPSEKQETVSNTTVVSTVRIIRPIPVKRKRDQSQQTTVNEFYPVKKQKTSKK